VRSVQGTVLALGTAQTLAWASSFYLPAVLAAPMARDLGLATPTVFAAFSLALGVAALVGPATGRWIDRHGGRGLLMATNGLFALGLAALGAAQGPVGLVLAWIVLGLAMGSGLYDAAFATLVRRYGVASRDPITGITLIAGFASTVGWPLSAWMSGQWGWRGACLGWAALHLLVALPLNALLPRATDRPGRSRSAALTAALSGDVDAAASTAAPTDRAAAGAALAATAPAPAARPSPVASALVTTLLLTFVFATTRFISTAIGAHGPALLMALGSTLAGAVAAGALIGPAQVGGRLLEFGLLRRLHPLLSARLATLGHPLGATALLLLGVPAAAPFALLHGAGNGILTIAKGTLPLVLFGPQGYGARQGWLSMPSLVLQALAPWLFGLLIERSAAGALMLSTALSLAALLALLVLRAPRG
jgi:predicted MFS family arabinose efflux permease